MPTPEPPPSRSSGPLRILYVEDNLNLRSVVARFLRGRTHLVETAGDGEEALLKITQTVATGGQPYEMLITDLQMPEMGGVELIRILREARLRLPIIVYSSVLTPESLEELAPLAIQAAIPKGTRPEFLAETVLKVAALAL